MATRKPAARERSALIVVDVQPDFFPGGALPVGEANRILEPLRRLMERDLFPVVAATQDWHPPRHVSFASRHEGKQPFETIELYGHEQTLWPDHCVQGTPGAELHPGLPWEKAAVIVRKGSDPRCDSYSGFRNNWNPDGKRPRTGLAGYLRDRGIGEVWVCGLARDVCVRWTAKDAAAEGFRVKFLWDLTRPVDPGSDGTVREELERTGVEAVSSEVLGR